MAADLEDLFEQYRHRGCSDEEAARRAEEKVLASPDVVERLVRLHRSSYEQWVDRVVARASRGGDLLLIGGGVLPMLALAAFVATPRVRTPAGDPLLWPLLVLGAVIAVLSVVQIVPLLRGRLRPALELERWTFSLFFLGIATPAVAATGFLIRLHAVAIGISAGEVASARSALVSLLGGEGALLGMGIALGIAAELVWFLLVSRIAAVRQSETAELLRE